MRKQAILYPSDRGCFSGVNHAPLVASYFSEPDARRLLIQPWRADCKTAVAGLRREVAGAAVDTVLISAEHFSSRFSPERIQRLADDFGWGRARIAVVARDPLARALSAYFTTIASGRDLTLDAFIDELCSPANPYLRHEETIGRWEQVFGREHVEIVAYAEGGDIVEQLARALLPSARLPAGTASYRRNVSGGVSATETLRRVNAGGRERGLGWARTAREMLRKSIRPHSHEKWRLTAEQRRRLNAIAEPDLAWLRSRGVDLARTDPP